MLQTRDVHAEVAGNGGTDLLLVEILPFDPACLYGILRESPQDRLLPEFEAEALHPADQPTLLVPDCSQGFDHIPLAPSELGPIRILVDIPR